MRVTLLTFTVFLLFACSAKTKKSWSEKDRSDFTTACENSATGESGLTKEKAKSYCECMLQKVQAKYPDINDTRKVEGSEYIDMGKECLK